MTHTEARDRAVSVIEAAKTTLSATEAEALKVKVRPRDGVVNGAEIARGHTPTPGVEVAILGRDPDIAIVAYVVTRTGKACERWTLALLDAVEGALRSLAADALPAVGGSRTRRPDIEPRTQTLYDAEMMKLSGVTLWAVTVRLPDQAILQAADEQTPRLSLWEEANTALQPAVDAALAPWAPSYPDDPAAEAAARARLRGMTEQDRRDLMLHGPLPFAEVVHGDGRIEQAGIGAIEWVQDGVSYRQRIAGVRAWPITLRIRHTTERLADAALTELLRTLPATWTWRGQEMRLDPQTLSPPAYEHGAQAASVTVLMRAPQPAGDIIRLRQLRAARVRC